MWAVGRNRSEIRPLRQALLLDRCRAPCAPASRGCLRSCIQFDLCGFRLGRGHGRVDLVSATEKDNTASNDAYLLASFAGLLPGAGFQPAVNVDQLALHQVANLLRKSVPGYDRVVVGNLFAVDAAIGGDSQLAIGGSLLRVSQLRFVCQASDDLCAIQHVDRPPFGVGIGKGREEIARRGLGSRQMCLATERAWSRARWARTRVYGTD